MSNHLNLVQQLAWPKTSSPVQGSSPKMQQKPIGSMAARNMQRGDILRVHQHLQVTDATCIS